MKKLLLTITLLALASNTFIFAQKSQGIGTNTPNPRAVLDINVESPSTYPQGLLLPRLTTTERTALGTVGGLAFGMTVFDTSDKNIYVWDGNWKLVGGLPSLFTLVGTNIRTLNNTNNIQLASTAGAYMIGTNTGLRMTDRSSIFIGNGAGQTADNNTQKSIFIGFNAGKNYNGANLSNIYLGDNAGELATGGGANNFIGEGAGRTNTTGGNFNNFIGRFAGSLNTSGSDNNFIGSSAGSSNTTGSGNNFFGKFSGSGNILGDNNIAIGTDTKFMSGNFTNANIFGLNTSATGSNQFVLGNAITGLGINTSAPTAMLDVNGGARIRTLTNTGSILTVDGLGNVGMGGTLAASQWNYTTFGGSNAIAPNPISGQVPLLYLKSNLNNTTSTSGMVISNSNGFDGAVYMTSGSFTGAGFKNATNTLMLEGPSTSGLGTRIYGNQVKIFSGGIGNTDPVIYATGSGKVAIGSGFIDDNANGADLIVKDNGVGNANYKAIDLLSNTTAAANNSVDIRFGLLAGTPFNGNSPETLFQAKISGISNNTGNAEGKLAFYTNGGSSLIERMQINSFGAVGIGVSTFTGFEALRIGGLNPTSPKGLVFPYVTTAQMVTLTAQLGAMDAGMIFFNTDFKDVAIWDGTKWQNKDGGGGGGGSGPDPFFWNIGGNTISGIPFITSTGYGKIGTNDKMNLAIVTDNQPRIFVGSVGGVSINNGSQVPKAQLQVNGDVGLGNGTETGNKPVVVWLLNKGGAANVGDIVVVDNTSDDSFNQTTVVGNNAAIGVLTEQCTGGSVCKVAIAGVVEVNITAPITNGQHCITGITPGRANSIAIPGNGASIGVFLQSVAAGTKARVLLR